MLGNMIRKVIAESVLNDINTGSALLTLLEACAQNDFDNNVAILSILELLNIDMLKNADLDTRAADFGLERINAIRASGFVTISDSSITKRSTTLFPIKPAPIAGSTVLYVNNASDWEPTGTLYIGQETANFEGPISYTSITNHVTYYSIQLSSALEKDHLISERVVDAQGTTDRLISAGTEINIPANNQSPAVKYNTLRDAVIPAGDDHVDNVEIIALKAGTQGNAGINTITNFTTLPFPTATITNSVPLTNGRDMESDFELRERIKSYSSTLARGTRSAILAAIVGVSDIDDNKQVASAVIAEPVTVGEPSIIYIDDGGGFEPSYVGQSVDTLLANASGTEEYLQLANYPLPRPQVVNAADGPYELTDGMTLRIRVDDDEETISFSSSDFANIAAATLPEIVTMVNDQSTLFKIRMTTNSTRLLIYPVAYDAEIIQVPPRSSTENASLYANSILKFPTNEFSYIKLYQNNTLLKEQEKAATLITTIFSTWGVNSDSNVVISVDGTPAQDQTFTLTDFGAASWNALTLSDWVTAFNSKFAGITASALSSGAMRISSNQIGDNSSLEILGGDLLNIWFSDLDIEAEGQSSNFELNRQNGNIKILTDIAEDDTISAGTDDAKGAIISEATTTGNFNVSADANGTPATLVIVADADEVIVRSSGLAAVGSTITISDQGDGVMRIMSSSISTFRNVHATTHDYIYIASRTSSWLSNSNTGLFKVVAKGNHTSAGTDTYIEVLNDDITAEGPISVLAPEDMQAFYADAYPQIWLGSMATTPASEAIEDLIDSINDNTQNVIASIYKTNKVKITSTTEDGGSIAIPVSLGNATLLFATGNASEDGNPPHVANRKTEGEMITWFKRTTPTSTYTWLDRYVYSDRRGNLAADATIGTEGIDAYAEILESTDVLADAFVNYDDAIYFTKGANKKQWKAIKQILSGDRVGTRYNKPATTMAHIARDEFQIVENLRFSAEDSIVTILDDDSVNKTVDVNIARTGRVNAGSQGGTFIPSNYALSADDSDNEIGVDFGTPTVWSKTLTNTEFADYKMWFRARNWYCANGVASSDGKMMLRAAQFGPIGEKIIFSIEYPTVPDTDATTVHENSPVASTYKYYFGSGSGRTTGITGTTTIAVSDLGSNIFKYTFTNSGDLSANGVVAGDVFSALSNSGISSSNRGQLIITEVGNWAVPANQFIKVYNPDGAATGVGAAEVTTVTTIADGAGTQRVDRIDLNGENGGTLDGEYFKLYDSNGSVAFWIDVDDSGTAEPAHGCSRSIEITTVVAADTEENVRDRLITVIGSDPEFSAAAVGATTDQLDVTHTAYELSTQGNAGTTAFSITEQVAGVDPTSLDGKYFVLQDQNGSVAVWMDVDNTGTAEPLHGADRSIAVTTITSGMSANNVALAVRAAINADSEFSAPAPGANVITVTDANVGGRPAPSNGTSGFTTATSVNGSNASDEIISVPTAITIFPLEGTAVSDIVDTINAEDLMIAVAIGDDSKTIELATRDETTAAVAYGHDTDPTSGNHDHVNLYDSENRVLNFSNSNPNFTFKVPLLLPGVEPTVYQMDTTPNYDDTETGEYFKLIPTTIQNVRHHLVHKALSQLPLVSDINIAGDNKKVQIVSEELGSGGKIEVVGGRANSASFSLIADSEIISESGSNFMATRIRSYPDTINPGDIVKFVNSAGAARYNRLSSTDSIDVVNTSGDYYDYMYNPKNIYFTPYVKVTITDVSAAHARPTGTVFRWTHADSGSYAQITADSNGAPDVYAATNYRADSGGTATNLEVISVHAGDGSNPQQFNLTLSDFPTQADYFLIDGPGSNELFGIWFDIDADGTPPAANVPYSLTDYQIEVDIATGDSVNDIIQKLVNTLSLDSDFNNVWGITQTSGATLNDVAAGDLLFVSGTFSGWSAGNMSSGTGDDKVAGFPIVAVDDTNRYFEIVNPYGEIMSATTIGISGSVEICPTPIIEWNVSHMARNNVSVTDVANVSTATTTDPHHLKVGDNFELLNNNALPSDPGSGIGTVVGVTGYNTFTYATSGITDATYDTGTIIRKNQDLVVAINEYVGGAGTPGAGDSGFTVSVFQEGGTNIRRVTEIITVADVAGSLDAKYFVLYDENGSVGFWFDVDDSGTGIPAGASACDRAVEITGVATGDDAATVAGVVQAAIDADSQFSSTIDHDRTRYKVEILGFKNLVRLSWAGGAPPRFKDCGVAIDDLLIISGTTFNSNNNGSFRVRGVDNISLIYENTNAAEEVNLNNIPFNNLGTAVSWTQNALVITGAAGSFENLIVGDSVKKAEDSGTLWAQVSSFNTGNPLTATSVTLSSPYGGTTGSSTGVKFNQITGVNAGVVLKSIGDLRILESDSVRTDDSLYVSSVVNNSWFNVSNTGTFDIVGLGTSVDYKPYVRVLNASGTVETNKLMSVDPTGFIITEHADNAYSSYRRVEHIILDSFDDTRRIVYVTPSDHSYKFSESNGSEMQSVGKLGYSTEVVSGVDGYLYYTGLLRTVQRTIDGYEPDSETYPGRRAVGGVIEILPPLIRRVEMSIDITTDEGVNLGEISNEIKTIIINYVNGLGVGNDVILSEIIAAIMDVSGVAAATFNIPDPSTERISIDDIEKAFIETSDISIA